MSKMSRFELLAAAVAVLSFSGRCWCRVTANDDSSINVVQVTDDFRTVYTTSLDIPYDYQLVMSDDSCKRTSDPFSIECCFKLDIPQIRFYFDGCGMLLLNKNASEIEMRVSLNNHIILDRVISAHNPPPVCFGGIYTIELADVCLRFYQLDASKTDFKGCAEVLGRLEEQPVVDIPLGCWDINV